MIGFATRTVRTRATDVAVGHQIRLPDDQTLVRVYEVRYNIKRQVVYFMVRPVGVSDRATLYEWYCGSELSLERIVYS